MANDKERTACCGLYCGDCIPANEALFDTADRLKQQLEDCRFDEYAKYKSTSNRVFESFAVFGEVLDAILTLRCTRTCPNGGGRPDCPIRCCARQKGLEGCWQCTAFDTCGLLEPLCACHGDTPRHNLRMVRQYGVENWAHKRGRHYLWRKTGEHKAD
jgi:hypothetical protein